MMSTLSHLVSGTSPRLQMYYARHTACSSRGARLPASSLTKSQTPRSRSTCPPSSLFPNISDRAQCRIYDKYSFSVIPLLGTILAGDRASYQYLVESIRRFPSQGDFAQMIADAGFATGGNFEGDGGAWRDLWGGIACIHTGVKL